MSQGEALQSMLVTLKTGLEGLQVWALRSRSTLVAAATILPPPGVTPAAPVGTTFKPSVAALVVRDFGPIKVEIGGIAYAIPAPARITVFDLPVGSQAKLTRGAKLLGSIL